MVQEQIKKLTLLINTVILILVFGLMGFFYLSDAWFLVWFSIPTAGVFFITNSIVVLGFVTFYSKVMIKMVIAAEEKLYFGKNNGKNRVVT
ncbi:MAG: hypothetical protein K6E26_01055 [Clostridiales bacterium]|nr:hypothetical protein [Clostridiales bacterium]